MKKILITILILLLIPIDFLAQDALYDPETALPVSETTICGNKEYTFVQDESQDRALVFLDGNNNYLTSKIINQTEYTFSIPTEFQNINVLVSGFEDNKINYDQMYKMSYIIEDCGYESQEEDLKLETNPLKVEYTGKKFNVSYEGAYAIKYQVKDSKILKPLPGEGIEVTSPSIVQLEIELAKGEEKYYEVQLINEEDYFIREVSTLQTREIRIDSFFSFKSILFLGITLMLYLYFRVKIKKLRKKRRRQMIRKRNLSKKDKKLYKKQIKRK